MDDAGRPRVVVITGGTGGIGFFSGLELAKTGARVLVTGRNPSRGQEAVQELIRNSGNSNIELIVGDVSSVTGVNALAEQITERLSKIDVLVNNAGYLGSERRDSPEGLEMHFAINVVAPRRLTQNLLPRLREADRARVINVTGGNGAEACDKDDLQAEKGFKGLMTYARSKGALEGVTGKFFDSKTKDRRLHSTAYEPEVQRAVVALADSV